ncbi:MULTISPECIES: hypothetical protein [Sphingomonas]|uniref:hypothetical protein n=1 Tax=Sphingomonas TaxID=13687 RepID=UPI00254F4927|nr:MULTISPECIES: hypothetical protein [Sphingomonas]MDK8188127.1 hypothetical protein [Sphingomonas zeae]MDK8217876.1 hypothetical protein [Sphingomonas sp. UMB7805-LC452B]
MRALIFIAALSLSGCESNSDARQDQIDDAASEAVAHSEKIAELEGKIDYLQQKDADIVNYVNALENYTKEVEKDRRKGDTKIVDYLTAKSRADAGSRQ